MIRIFESLFQSLVLYLCYMFYNHLCIIVIIVIIVIIITIITTLTFIFSTATTFHYLVILLGNNNNTKNDRHMQFLCSRYYSTMYEKTYNKCPSIIPGYFISDKGMFIAVLYGLHIREEGDHYDYYGPEDFV